MAGLSIWHVLIFAIVVILLFGKDVSGAIKDFKKTVREDEPKLIEHEQNEHTSVVRNESQSQIKS